MKQKLILLTGLFWLSSHFVMGQEIPKQRSINVSGSAEMEIVPDEIYVQVELREYDKKGVGKTDIETIKNEFLKAATSIGIADSNIVVQGYQGNDGNYWWWYKKSKKKNPDMKAGVTYQVKVSSTKKLDELVQKMDDEATQNFFIASVSHSNEQAIRKQLKIQAVKAAKEKAEYLSAAIGEKIGEAILINEPNENVFVPAFRSNTAMMSNMRMEDENTERVPDVNFKKIKYRYEVNVIFALK